jgi:hypothetical protein
MIRNPTRAAGLRFEENRETGERLDDKLHEAAADPEALPLLEFTLAELYDRRTEDGILTFAAYQELGSLEGALAKHAERVFSAQPALAAVLQALVTVEHGEEEIAVTRRGLLASLTSSRARQTLVNAQ